MGCGTSTLQAVIKQADKGDAKISIDNEEDWSNNEMNAFCKHLVEKQNKTLLTLSAQKLKIGTVGIADLLKANLPLKELNLNSNSFGPSGFITLSQALKVNTHLEVLNMRDTFVGDECCLPLAEALKENVTLRSLDLSGCTMSDKGQAALADAVKAKPHPALVHLYLKEGDDSFLNTVTGTTVEQREKAAAAAAAPAAASAPALGEQKEAAPAAAAVQVPDPARA